MERRGEKQTDRLRFGAITRGEGKVYVGILGVSPAEELRIHACFSDGSYVPVSLLRPRSGDVVAMFPAFKRTVELSVSHGSGSARNRISQRFDYVKTKTRSRINTLLKNQDALRIRNCDCEELPGNILFHDVQLISACDEEIVQFTLEYPASREADASPVQVFCMDEVGCEIALRPFTVLGETVVPERDLPGLTRRVIRASCSIHAGIASFCLAAHSPSDSVGDGICSVFPERAAQLREAWRVRTLSVGEDPAYNDWFTAHRALPCDLRSQIAHAEGFTDKPLFSLLADASTFDAESFKSFVQSLGHQSYQRHELVLYGSKESLDTLGIAVPISIESVSIRAITCPVNLDERDSLMRAVGASLGDYCCFVEAAGMLEADTLYWIAEAINRHEGCGLLYGDDDALESGRFVAPSFKPDWDPYLLGSQYYLGGLVVLKRDVADVVVAASADESKTLLHHIACLAGQYLRDALHVKKVLFHRIDSAKEPRCDLSPSWFDRAEREDVEADSLAFLPCGDFQEERLALLGRSFARSLGCGDCPIVPVRFDSRDSSSLRRLMEAIRASGCERVLVFDASLSMDRRSLMALVGWLDHPHAAAVSARVVYRDGTMRNLGMLCSDGAMATPLLHGVPGNPEMLDELVASAHMVSAVGEGALCLKSSAVLGISWDYENVHPLLWAEDLSIALRDQGWDVLVEPASEAVVDWSPIELYESNWVISTDRLHAHASLRRRWSQYFTQADPYYGGPLRGDGYYGLLAHE